MLCGGNGVSTRRVQDDDAAARGRLNIDIVHADSGATDHAQSHTGIQDLRRHLCLAADNERAELRNNFDQLRFGQARLKCDFEHTIA